MGYDYNFEYAFPEVAEGALIGAVGIVATVVLLILLVCSALALVCYVLKAVGMYRIAKRRGIHHAWLAWVPIGCNWLLGSISDHYQYVAKQKVTSKRKVLLILSLILVACLFVLIGGVVALVLATEGMAGDAAMVLAVALMLIAYLGMLGLAIAITVFCYIAYYDLFRSCKPGNAVLFLVLSIIFNVTLAFFVFACSKSDEGMPERRPRDPAPQIPDVPAAPETPEAEETSVVEGEIVEDSE